MQPRIYSVEEHKIDREKLDTHAFYIIHKLREAGFRAYLVGGGVRDLLLGLTPKDFDISTSAEPEEIRALFRNSLLIGRRFRLAHVRFGKKIFEVSTFRKGDTESADLIIRDNIFGTEEEDVLRRDFTINGLYYDPESEEVIDYVGGYEDLQKKLLRTIGKPDVRFIQDPVRMIRLIKFTARLEFDVEKPTFEALVDCRKEILKSSPHRIFEELLRMLESGAAKEFFHLLHQYGILKALLPELSHFLELKPETTLFSLLSEIDSDIKKHTAKPFDRTLPIAALIFPLFEEYLKKISHKKPHLGKIQETAHYVIDAIFHPFFMLPRRTKSIVAFLLASQYRFIPLDGKSIKSPKAPKDPFFPTALYLLKLRSSVQKELLSHYTLWSEVSFEEIQDPLSSEDKRKRRRRRR